MPSHPAPAALHLAGAILGAGELSNHPPSFFLKVDGHSPLSTPLPCTSLVAMSLAGVAHRPRRLAAISTATIALYCSAAKPHLGPSDSQSSQSQTLKVDGDVDGRLKQTGKIECESS